MAISFTELSMGAAYKWNLLVSVEYPFFLMVVTFLRQENYDVSQTHEVE